MNCNKYEISKDESSTIYDFISIGDKGKFRKVISFSPSQNPSVYDLSFGDLKYDVLTRMCAVDDEVTNNNGDIKIVLATVAKAVYNFTDLNPDITLFFRSSDTRKTRVYKRVIMLNLDKLSKNFNIYGARIIDNQIRDEPFDYKKDFDGFLIQRKKNETTKIIKDSKIVLNPSLNEFRNIKFKSGNRDEIIKMEFKLSF
ncbi:hypothetical protein ASF10_21175 [Flavobacterium sp. Leaf82]|uniref:DUF6934 family protein n=1 Tax=Flavobacterium sp. Leaf82 TaxID=1736238 RepID=UPI0006F46421|nr:hypothetical protein [Flavobacterium sp. Leaf82]KQO32673.1 hypothetical protein ASF10_21175 [Flavobacterium sp. Leaf82]